MTLEQLRIFIAVAEREHLTRAAEALRLTPSAVSSAIRALEDRYGAMLFNRIGRRIEITDAGRIFLDEARAVLARAHAAELALAELGGLKRGSLRIHASQTIASYWLPPFLARFHAAYPAVTVSLTVGNTQSVARATVEGDADVGFVEGEVDEPALAVRPVGEDHLVAIVSASHPWADGHLLGWRDIAQADWIMREQGSGTRSVFESAMRAQGFDPLALKIALELPSNEAVLSAVQSGTYAAVLSELAAAPHLATGRLTKANFNLPRRRFLMLSHKERYRSRAFHSLAEMLPDSRPIPVSYTGTR
ncbi:LysR family transcriptional regulator [Paramesorhizobium deserti]|uniref:LysR family transcriptional regulator n=1 Tax=Paramesorhizobium deserti TaxID=1494590 RepID=A0A135I0S3_9HYPH|nr:LysR family transcriptional regulator [Paramesorhizobium deserti]KXF79008.1 LysR family transcriptional regulator [Paramesorhizobium deserti]